MHILVGGAVIIAILYVWLTGHWFGRVLAFLAFGIFSAGIALLGYEPPEKFLYAAICVTLAWFISGIPTYWQRAKHAPFHDVRLTVQD